MSEGHLLQVDDEGLEALDPVLSRSTFSALEVVHLRVVDDLFVPPDELAVPPPYPSGPFARVVEAKLPRLYARGIVEVSRECQAALRPPPPYEDR